MVYFVQKLNNNYFLFFDGNMGKAFGFPNLLKMINLKLAHSDSDTLILVQLYKLLLYYKFLLITSIMKLKTKRCHDEQ